MKRFYYFNLGKNYLKHIEVSRFDPLYFLNDHFSVDQTVDFPNICHQMSAVFVERKNKTRKIENYSYIMIQNEEEYE